MLPPTQSRRMRVALWVGLGVLSTLAGCACSAACNGALCGPCQEALVVHITGASAATVATLDGGTCTSASGALTCTASPAPGEHDVTLTIDGAPRTLHVTIAPAPAGCCTCSPTTMQTVDLGAAIDAGPGDASAPPDAGSTDSGQACDPSVVVFPAGGSLVVGQLCDDVFACVASAADATALQAAAPDFTCDPAPVGGCTGITCRYSTSTLDEAELAEVCTVTVLSPQPSVTCMIYL